MRFLSVLIAVLSGILVLLGYFLPALQPIQNILLRWTIILVGVAAFLGVFGLISVHADRIRRREKGTPYSILLFISLASVFFFTLVLGPNHPVAHAFFNAVILPTEATLMALLAVTLVYAAIRMLRRRADLMSIVFLGTVVVVLIGSATLPFGEVPLIGTVLVPWLTQVLAIGGARGILIGVALGTLTTGLRVLMTIDRPYGGS